jgi:hypothetical protein
MPNDPFEYDRLCIRDFIVERVGNIDDLCFFLENKWNRRYAYIRLLPGKLVTQAQEVIQIATLNHEIGELVFYLCKYWLESLKYSPQVLIDTGLALQLKVYAKECKNKGNRTRYEEIQKILARDTGELHAAPSSLPGDPTTDPPPPITKPEVFISYAWGGDSEKMVDQIDAALQTHGITIIRDKRDLGFKGLIKEFMERIGRGDCVIVVISDKYLRSPNCMFELIEVAENKQFHERIFPIVLADANIYDPVKRLEYVKYWEDKRNELAQKMREIDPANLHGIRDDMDLYDRIRDKVSGLASILKNMNTLTPEIHAASGFSTLIDALEARCGKATHKGE